MKSNVIRSNWLLGFVCLVGISACGCISETEEDHDNYLGRFALGRNVPKYLPKSRYSIGVNTKLGRVGVLDLVVWKVPLKNSSGFVQVKWEFRPTNPDIIVDFVVNRERAFIKETNFLLRGATFKVSMRSKPNSLDGIINNSTVCHVRWTDDDDGFARLQCMSKDGMFSWIRVPDETEGSDSKRVIEIETFTGGTLGPR